MRGDRPYNEPAEVPKDSNVIKSTRQHFGISAGVALKTLPQLADAFKRLGNFRSQYYGKLFGLDEATILLLQQGRREVEAII